MDFSERRDAVGWQFVVHTLTLGVLTCICTITFVPSHQILFLNLGLLLALLVMVMTVILARFCWLKQVKGDNGGHIHNGWKEMWELFPDSPFVWQCLIFLVGAKLCLDAAPKFAGKLLDRLAAGHN
jgi:hypothetical protein